jgi:peptidoglycan/xylan/chitin deacetylase (PgdA/CDA1 family)
MRIRQILSPAFALVLIFGSISAARSQENPESPDISKQEIISRFHGRVPQQWAEVLPGVKTRLDTRQKVIALTFDACGSEKDGYDTKLINFLVQEGVPATLFINSRWIDKNPETFRRLAADKLFEIENHGWLHRPCSVNGKSVYGIRGTANPGEVYDEVEQNAEKIWKLTGRKPGFYRSGTAYYDEVALEIVKALGSQAVGFSVLGDAGATYSAARVKAALLTAVPGSIIICHMNHPEKETAEGVIAAVPELKKRGFRFVRLSEYNLK